MFTKNKYRIRKILIQNHSYAKVSFCRRGGGGLSQSLLLPLIRFIQLHVTVGRVWFEKCPGFPSLT